MMIDNTEGSYCAPRSGTASWSSVNEVRGQYRVAMQDGRYLVDRTGMNLPLSHLANMEAKRRGRCNRALDWTQALD